MTIQLKHKAGSTVKLAPRGHVVMRMHLGYSAPESSKKVLTAADFGVAESGEAASSSASGTDGAAAVPTSAGINLFADSFVPSFFRLLLCNDFSGSTYIC